MLLSISNTKSVVQLLLTTVRVILSAFSILRIFYKIRRKLVVYVCDSAVSGAYPLQESQEI
jgi:hypothetical protein